jgi:transcriptional regulator with XRE-family HTH domain
LRISKEFRQGNAVGQRSADAHTLLTMGAWWDYVQQVTEGASQIDIAKKVDISSATVSRWKTNAAAGDPAPVAAFARAYGRPVLEAFVAAGFLTAEEAAVTEVQLPDDVSSRTPDEIQMEINRLVRELQRRAEG